MFFYQGDQPMKRKIFYSLTIFCLLVGLVVQVIPARAAPNYGWSCIQSSSMVWVRNIGWYSAAFPGYESPSSSDGWISNTGDKQGWNFRSINSNNLTGIFYNGSDFTYSSNGGISTTIEANNIRKMRILSHSSDDVVELCQPIQDTPTPTITSTAGPTLNSYQLTQTAITPSPTPDPNRLWTKSISLGNNNQTFGDGIEWDDLIIPNNSCGTGEIYGIFTQVTANYNQSIQPLNYKSSGPSAAVGGYGGQATGYSRLTRSISFAEGAAVGWNFEGQMATFYGLDSSYMAGFSWPKPQQGSGYWYYWSGTVDLLCRGGEDTPQITTNLLCDGDMEQYFESTCWLMSDFGSITKPNGQSVEYTWDRLNTLLAPWPLSWSNWWANGDAVCGTGYHGVGKQATIGTDLWAGQGKGVASAIEQQFDWAGGTIYWRASARGKFGRILPPTPPGKAMVTILGDGGSYPLIDEEDLTVDWKTFSGSLDLPQGHYKIKLDSWDKENFLINTIDDGAVYFDDVYLSETPISGDACEDNTPDIEGTPTPTLTTTPNPSATVITTATLAYTTPTPNLTPTATLNPEILYIWNCGFEAGSTNWGIGQNSSITLAGGPTGPQALRASGSWPNAWQTFSSKGEYTYLTAWIKGQATIRAVNLSTGVALNYYTSTNYEWAWKKIYSSLYLPPGIYRLELNNTTPPGGEAFYDGVTLSYNNYATAAESWCAAEPTPGPTPFVTATAERTPTTGPSATPWPSPTSAFWWTPIPSGTPQPSTTPNYQATAAQSTATAQGTPNAWQQTATAWGTATAQGTPAPTGSGPSFQGTPNVTPPYGGGGVGGGNGNGGTGAGPCPKPDFWKDGFGTWIDAAVCEAKYYMSWSAGNSDQISQFVNETKRKEPFGTIGEMSDAMNAVNTMLKSYNWTGQGLPGTHTKGVGIFSLFTNQAPGWITGVGGFQLLGTGPAYRSSCSNQVADFVGPRISPGMCFIFDVLYQNNLMPIFQFFIDGSTLMALFFYIRNQWLKYM
jgi:hypothetical protein